MACFELLQQPVDSRMIEKKLWKLWCEAKGLPVGKEPEQKCSDKRITEQGVCVSVPRGIRPILTPHRVEVRVAKDFSGCKKSALRKLRFSLKFDTILIKS